MDAAQRSALMARIRSRDTAPEMTVRRWLFSRGYRFRKNVKGLPGSPDIVLHKYHTAIFVNGCFWHGHKEHFRMPASNSAFWKAKIERNRRRDERVHEALRRMGWNVITVWECSLTPKTRQATLMAIEARLNSIYLSLRKASLRRTYTEVDEGLNLAEAAEPAFGYGDDTAPTPTR